MTKRLPETVFKTRVRDPEVPGPNPFRWQDVSSRELFSNKRVAIFALPGAFTPTCSSTHLPRYDELYDEFKSHGIDEIYCLSVNDAFVMFQWGQHLGNQNVKLLPDGNGEFTRKMGMLVAKDNKTLLIYFHMDGQPVDPSKWNQESPYIPVLKKKK